MRAHGYQRIEARALLIVSFDTLQQALREFRAGQHPLREAGMDVRDTQFCHGCLWVRERHGFSRGRHGWYTAETPWRPRRSRHPTRFVCIKGPLRGSPMRSSRGTRKANAIVALAPPRVQEAREAPSFEANTRRKLITIRSIYHTLSRVKSGRFPRK